MMDENYIRERITSLRIEKNVSEYKMSLDLGHSKGYIQSITSGRAMPSITEFMYICDYFGITPSQFFDENNPYPVMINRIIEHLQNLNQRDLELILSVSKRLDVTE